jgi:hypothetical protein
VVLCAVVISAEVLGAGIWGRRCGPGCAWHEAEVVGLEVLDVGHEP